MNLSLQNLTATANALARLDVTQAQDATTVSIFSDLSGDFVTNTNSTPVMSVVSAKFSATFTQDYVLRFSTNNDEFVAKACNSSGAVVDLIRDTGTPISAGDWDFTLGRDEEVNLLIFNGDRSYDEQFTDFFSFTVAAVPEPGAFGVAFLFTSAVLCRRSRRLLDMNPKVRDADF